MKTQHTLRAVIASCLLLPCCVGTAFANRDMQNAKMEDFLQKAVKAYLIPGLSVCMVDGNGVVYQFNSDTIRDGLISIINGKQPSFGVGKTPVAIAAAILLLVAVSYAFRIIRLMRSPKFGVLRKVTFCSDIAIAIFIAVGFIPLMNWIMGKRADWKMLWDLLPEFCLLLGLIFAGNLICVCVKIKQGLIPQLRIRTNP